MQTEYQQLVNKRSDINEHLPTLFEYSKTCERILELGVRGCVSSWAFAHGLHQNDKATKYLFCNDLTHCNITSLVSKCTANGVTVDHKWCSDLDLEFENDSFDLVFIDTWHVYGHLKRELLKFGRIAKKFIIMHDTTIDGVHSEIIRMTPKSQRQAQVAKFTKETGLDEQDVITGLQPAIDEFLKDHPEWTLRDVFTNNNGLTVLEKKMMTL